VDLRLDHHVVLVEEVELGFMGAPWGLVSVIADHTFGYLAIVLGVFLIEHNEEKIETGEKGVGKADVLAYWLITSVFSIDGVGCSDH
jgi:hypothetical protein